MDVNKLVYALDNDNNESIMNLTTKKIKEMNLHILKELHLDKQTTFTYLKKLDGYRYVDEINDVKHGAFIRWIPISDPTYLPLHNACIICEIKITDDGIFIVCKNFMHRYYTFKMDECLIFQKLTSQEQVILSALNHLENSKNESDFEEEENSDNAN